MISRYARHAFGRLEPFVVCFVYDERGGKDLMWRKKTNEVGFGGNNSGCRDADMG